RRGCGPLAAGARHGPRRARAARRSPGRRLPRPRAPVRDRSSRRRAVHRSAVAAQAPVPAQVAGRAGARRVARRLSASGERPGSDLRRDAPGAGVPCPVDDPGRAGAGRGDAATMMPTRPRVVFMGTPEFAVPSLRDVARGFEVAAVVTQPDRPRGRGRKLGPSAVAVAAGELKLKTFKPETLKSQELLAEIRALNPELLAVVAF